MTYWIRVASVSLSKDLYFVNKSQFVELRQNNHPVKIGDVVYIYARGYNCVLMKYVVEKIDIEEENIACKIEDYYFINKQTTPMKKLFMRLKFIEETEAAAYYLYEDLKSRKWPDKEFMYKIDDENLIKNIEDIFKSEEERRQQFDAIKNKINSIDKSNK